MLLRTTVLCLFFLGVHSPALLAQSPKYEGSIKIVNLLWEANGKSAATTLQKTIDSALARGQVTEVGQALSLLEPKLASLRDKDDPRYPIALAAQLLIHAGNEAQEPPELVSKVHDWVVYSMSHKEAELSEQADLLLRSWFVAQPNSAFESLQEFLTDDSLPTRESLVLACLRASFQIDASRSFAAIQDHWSQVPAAARLQVIEPMTSTAEQMAALLKAIKSGSIDRSLVNTNQLRKWTQELADPTDIQKQIKVDIESIWGKIRVSDNAERQALVQATLKLLQSGVAGSATRGKVVFGKACSQCHRLHGQGYEVGPNIAGNGRGSLQQLVSNVLDPSLVIGEAFQSTTVLTVDSKVVSGIVAGESEQYLKLKTQGGKIVEFDKEDLELVKASDKSLMPEGLEVQLMEQELIDLFAYLCLLKPLGEEDNALIPGTPADLVQE